MLMDTGTAHEDMLLSLLNTTPVVDGTQQDHLAGSAPARQWLLEHGGSGSAKEQRAVREVRDDLQRLVRGEREPAALAKFVSGVSYRPVVTGDGITWQLDAPADRRTAALAVLAWNRVHQEKPDRLRPCANPDCRLFLLDRSKANRARWCSMTVCGNRMKARRHYTRVRDGDGGGATSAR